MATPWTKTETKAAAQAILIGMSYPAFLWAKNRGEAVIGELTTPLLLVSVGTVLALVAARLLRRSVVLSSLVIAGAWPLFFLYSAIANAALDRGIQPRYAFPAAVLLVVGGLYGLGRRGGVRLQGAMVDGLLVAGLVLMLQPATALFQNLTTSATDASKASAAKTKASDGDVLMILLDGYGSADVLQRFMGFDNGPFLAKLEERGFAVTRSSSSSYTHTLESMSSTFNLDYLDKLPIEHANSAHLDGVRTRMGLIHTNAMNRIAEAAGYKPVAVLSVANLFPWRGTNFRQLEVSFKTSPYFLSLFGGTPLRGMVRDSSLFAPVTVDGKAWAPDSTQWVLDKLSEFVANGRPDYIFAHILSPHSPYYHDAECNLVAGHKDTPWDSFKGDFRDFRGAYLDQLQCVNRQVLTAVDHYLKSPTPPRIIVLHADHGPPEIDSVVLARENIPEAPFRLGIVNAVYGSEALKKRIEDGDVLLNTFRAVAESLSGKPHPAVPKRQFPDGLH